MLSGLAVINKPAGITSHDAVEIVRRLVGHKKVGHFGTLDPMAEGVLLIGIGKATKFFDFYSRRSKRYVGTIKFGFATATYDREGDPLGPRSEVNLDQVDIQELLQPFIGTIKQTPPLYSAKKHRGKPLYKYARANQNVKAEPVTITVFSLTGKVLGPDMLGFDVLASSGTYIRSLAHELGESLGVGAHLDSLTRTEVGEFDLSQAVTIHPGNRIDADSFRRRIIPIETLLPEFAKIIVNQSGRRQVLNGQPLAVRDVLKIMATDNQDCFRLFDEEGRLLALARKDEDAMRFKPTMVLPE